MSKILSFPTQLLTTQVIRPLMRLTTSEHTKVPTRMIWALSILTAVFAYVNTVQIAPNDFWWHMAVGRDILTTGTIPSVDVFSHTMAGEPYLSYQMFWLMDVWLYGWYSLGGPELILFIHSLIITSAYAIIMVLCWQNSQRWGVTSVCLVFAITLGIYGWSVRPQAISFLIGSLFLFAIYTYRRNHNPSWLLVFPLGMLVWVNSHGSFPVGLLMLGIWFVDEIYLVLQKHDNRTTIALLAPGFTLFATSVICLINPRGAGITSYLILMASNPAVQTSVPEWAPPSFTSPIGPLFFASILLTAFVFSLSKRRPSFFQLVSFMAFSSLGLWTTRGVIWYGLAMAPILGDHLPTRVERISNAGREKKQSRSVAFINLALLVFLVFLACVSLPWLRDFVPMQPESKSLITSDTPVKATKFIASKIPSGNLFNDMAFGSYIIWAGQPAYKVFVDPRIELFHQSIWDDYDTISNAYPGWVSKLEQYGVRTLMLNATVQKPLIMQLDGSSQWHLIYQDEIARIYEKVW